MDTAMAAAGQDALEAEVRALRSQVAALARANVHAAELVAELHEARELEDLLRRRNVEIAQSRAAERSRSAVLENIARNEPVEVVFESLLDFASAQLAQPLALFVSEAGELRLSMHRNLPPEFVPWLRAFPLELGSPLGDCWSAGQPVQSNLSAKGSQFEERCRGAGFRACYYQPFATSARAVLGVVMLFCTEARELSKQDMDAMASAAVLAGLGLEQRGLYEQLSYQAHYDALTTLPNRIHFDQVLTRLIEEARESGTLLAVLWVDLDRFKQINDTLGHRAGDTVLMQAAKRLRQSVRSGDMVARIGGDEFILVLRRIAGLDAAVAAAHSILGMFETPFQVQDHELVVNASIGTSLYPQHGSDAETLSRNADIAMYNAKHGGRNAVAVFTAESDRQIRDRFQLEVNLRRAVELGELELYFQPQVRLASPNTISGVEALLRWHNETLGSVPPDRFIPVAEASGLIVSIGLWVLTEACRVAASWELAGHRLRMAVNVSSEQFARPDFVQTVAATLAASGLSPDLLELELTESAILRDGGQAVRNMEELRGMGVALAVDDFGTGYSSLSYLHCLPVNTLKVDRSFVKELTTNGSSRRLVEAVVQLAKALKLEVVAEGVETQEQLTILEDMGCSAIQGHSCPKRVSELKRSAS